MLIGAGMPAYVAAEALDMSKSIDALAVLVQGSLPVSPLSGALFVFFNRGRDKVKLLWWDRHGFWLAYKRLEKGSLRIPAPGPSTLTDLALVLERAWLSCFGVPRKAMPVSSFGMAKTHSQRLALRPNHPRRAPRGKSDRLPALRSVSRSCSA